MYLISGQSQVKTNHGYGIHFRGSSFRENGLHRLPKLGKPPRVDEWVDQELKK